MLAGGVLTTAGLIAFAVAPRIPDGAARVLLRLWAASVVLPMPLGVDYALSGLLGWWLASGRSQDW